MKTLYLHIGLPKTGTTSIQNFCENNQERLNQKGYVYPLFTHRYTHVSARRNGHFLVGMCKRPDGKRNFKKEEKLRQQGLQMVVEAFEKYPCVILSDENLWHGSIKRQNRTDLWKLLAEHSKEHGYQVKVIVYLRRQDDLALSWINQKVKSGWSYGGICTWEHYMEHPEIMIMDYEKPLKEIISTLGREALCVRVFERGQFQGREGTLISDFMEAIGLELDDSYSQEETFSNTSLTYNGQEIKRIVNSLPDSDEETYLFVRDVALNSLGTSVREERYDYLSVEERKEYLSRFEEGNQYVARELLGREDGKLFKDVTAGKEKWTPDNPYMREDIIRFFGEMALVQEKQIRELQRELDAVKTQLTELQAENENEKKAKWYGLFKRT